MSKDQEPQDMNSLRILPDKACQYAYDVVGPDIVKCHNNICFM